MTVPKFGKRFGRVARKLFQELEFCFSLSELGTCINRCVQHKSFNILMCVLKIHSENSITELTSSLSDISL